ncbi:MAG: mechanosensitive ion channel [Candidatus Omnitrophica bacterium]|nr:mechanosensitive ion channel [Candidatus Omnitrophota bacterium]
MKRFKGLIAGLHSLWGLLFADIAFCQEQGQGGSNVLFGAELSTAKKLLDALAEFFVKYSFQVLGGIIVLIVGFWIAKIIARFLEGFCQKHKLDVTVTKFLIQIVKILIIAFATLIALGNFGITIAPLIAGLSVVGFGTSFALQGPLSNYAAGITLIFTKPFKVGDIIEVQEAMGEVQDITLARTEVMTVDGTKIVIPNKQIIGEIIHNYTSNKKLDMKVGVSYDSDIERAISIVKSVVKGDERISEKPEPKIGISEFADSSINIYLRLWCKQRDYWDVMFEINRRIHYEFKKNNITIPFPQRDIHVYESKKTIHDNKEVLT